HLHRFLIHGKAYGIAYGGGMGFDDDPRLIRLRDFQLRLRERFLYEYDCGDHWQHDIRVEQLVAADAKRTYPVCIGGKGAAPPEECGGAEVYLAQWRRWKYECLCGRLQDRVRDAERDFCTEEEGEEILEPGYDPDHFDRREVMHSCDGGQRGEDNHEGA